MSTYSSATKCHDAIYGNHYEYRGYKLVNSGYHPPDRCIWWEAINTITGEHDHRETTKRMLMHEIDRYGDADQ